MLVPLAFAFHPIGSKSVAVRAYISNAYIALSLIPGRFGKANNRQVTYDETNLSFW